MRTDVAVYLYYLNLFVLVSSLYYVVLGLRLLLGRVQSGGEPRCGNCTYNLTGLTGHICPECGKNILASSIVLGVSRRTGVSILSGVAVILAGALGFSLSYASGISLIP